MKILHKYIFIILLITMFAYSRAGTDINIIKSPSELKIEILDTIGENIVLSEEIIAVMKNCNMNGMTINGNEDMLLMMMENRDTMMKILINNPGLMQNMMFNMLEVCKNDSVMMSGMCESMLGNQQMMDMMHRRMGENEDLGKMSGMKKDE